jgi:hypothetical protein
MSTVNECQRYFRIIKRKLHENQSTISVYYSRDQVSDVIKFLKKFTARAVLRGMKAHQWRTLFTGLGSNIIFIMNNIIQREWTDDELISIIQDEPRRLASERVKRTIHDRQLFMEEQLAGQLRPKGGECPKCKNETSLTFSYRMRSTGPGSKSEPIKLSSCHKCTYKSQE